MFPYSLGYDSDFSLHSDDIEGIQALYGANKNPMTTAEPPTPSTPTSDGDIELCNDGSIDTIFNSEDGVTYVFKGKPDKLSSMIEWAMVYVDIKLV